MPFFYNHGHANIVNANLFQSLSGATLNLQDGSTPLSVYGVTLTTPILQVTAVPPTVTINGALSITGGITFAGPVTITDTTESTDKDTGALIVEGGVGIEKNLNVGGSLTVNGTITTVNTVDLVVKDKFIGLGLNNPADTSDLGIWMEYDDGVIKYAGLFRDNSDSDKFKLFDGVLNSVDNLKGGANTITTAPVPLATLDVNKLEANYGLVTAPSITFVGDDDTGIFRNADDNLGIATGGTLKVEVEVGATNFRNLSSGLNLYPHGVAAGNTTELRFLELAANGSNYVGFKAPDAIGVANPIWTLPDAHAVSNGQALTATTAGVLSWSTVITEGGQAGPITIGTNDATAFNLETNNVNRITINSGGGVVFIAGQRCDFRVEAGAGPYLLTELDHMVEFSNAGATSVTLPDTSTEAGASGREFILIKTSSTASGNVTISRSGADVIDTAATSVVLNTQYDRVVLRSNGAGRWYTM
jgi:hypothetical protein